MTLLKTAAILALAGLLVSTGLAVAADTNPLSGPIHLGPATPGPIEVNPGGDLAGRPFGAGDSSQVYAADLVKVSPHAMSCSVGVNGWIWLRNVGTETIPAGSVITVTWPDGTKTTVNVNSDMKPGAVIDISVPPGVDFKSFGHHCSARAMVA